MILAFLANHWLLIAALVVAIAALLQPVLVWKFKAWILLAVVLWWGWTGHAAADALQAKYEVDKAKAANAALQAIADEQAKTAKAQAETIAALRKIPHTGQKVADAVHANPTPDSCVVPDDVIDGLSEGIAAGADATL